ncbi:MAG: hypothetical protein JXA87_02445 [Thermoleophilia bacterium]|nr:hypothetical protein [Thermoleophilia bacterium]
MRMPPWLVSMRLAENGRTKFRLWFPLFLLWPLILVFLLLTLIATLVADLVTLLSGRKPTYTRLILGVLGVVSQTRGTEVFVQESSNHDRVIAFTLR